MGTRSELKRGVWLLICFLLLASPFGSLAQEGGSEAEDLTSRCTFSFSGAYGKQEYIMTDGRTASSCKMETGDRLTIKSPSDMRTLVLRLSKLSSAFCLLEQDRMGLPLQVHTIHTDAAALSVSLKEGCRWVQIVPLEDTLRISEVTVFGPGFIPEDIPHPEAALEKTDFLLVATHPDDEWVFLGGVYPIYGGEKGFAGTVVYVTLPSWERAHECINSLWIGGVRTHPFFLGFPDIDQRSSKKQRARCKQEDVTLALVRLYRRIQPLVVVTQDPENGEYGHWQHKLSADAARDAVQLAADPTYDLESVTQYGTWTVCKLYQHFAQGMSQVELDVDVPLTSYGGQTALDVAKAAFQAHKSQLRTPYRPGHSNPLRGDIRHFGLTWSTVGPDTGNDLFEHIPEELLAANRKPTPTPTLEPTPTVGPTVTPTPTAEPALTTAWEPTARPVPEATPTTTPSVWDGAEQKAAWAADHAGPLAAGAVAAIALAAVGKQYRRARHRKRKAE